MQIWPLLGGVARRFGASRIPPPVPHPPRTSSTTRTPRKARRAPPGPAQRRNESFFEQKVSKSHRSMIEKQVKSSCLSRNGPQALSRDATEASTMPRFQRPSPCPGFVYTTSSNSTPRPLREPRKQAPVTQANRTDARDQNRIVLQGYDFSLVRSKLHTGYTSRSTIIHHLLILQQTAPQNSKTRNF